MTKCGHWAAAKPCPDWCWTSVQPCTVVAEMLTEGQEWPSIINNTADTTYHFTSSSMIHQWFYGTIIYYYQRFGYLSAVLRVAFFFFPFSLHTPPPTPTHTLFLLLLFSSSSLSLFKQTQLWYMLFVTPHHTHVTFHSTNAATMTMNAVSVLLYVTVKLITVTFQCSSRELRIILSAHRVKLLASRDVSWL